MKFFIDIEAKKEFLRTRVYYFADKLLSLKEIVWVKSGNRGIMAESYEKFK